MSDKARETYTDINLVLYDYNINRIKVVITLVSLMVFRLMKN